MRGLQDALSTHADFVHGGIAPRLVPDSVAALTALNADSRLPSKGVVALLDFGGGGTSITLADAASGFTPMANTLRFSEFSGDLVDQALMVHALDSAGHSSGARSRQHRRRRRNSPVCVKSAVWPKSGCPPRRRPIWLSICRASAPASS